MATPIPTAIPDIGAFFSTSDIGGWDVVIAVLIIIAGWILSIFARKGALALLKKVQGISVDLANLTARIIKYFVILLAVGVALGFLGASVQPLLAGAIIIGVLLALALRGIANNFAAGIVIQTRRPIKIGDEIEIDDYVGTVKDLNSRSVYVLTRDGRTVHIPNEHVIQNPLVNYSEAGSRRSEVEVRAMLDDLSPATLETLLRTTVSAIDGVHKREKVHVLTEAMSSDRVTYRVRFWHRPLAGPEISSEVVHAVGLALQQAGITFAVQSELPAPPLTPSPDV
jgi:small conductance mechanosensitive channel